MAIATGVAKQLRYKKESSWATAPGATGAQLLRRVTSNLSLKKNTYESAEIRSDYQDADFRHGTRKADGSIAGEFSLATFRDFIAAAVRKDWVAGATSGGIAVVAASSSGNTFTRSAGSWFTDGFKIGDVVRWTGWVTATTNNNKNYRITSLTATVMTVAESVVTRAEGDTVTCTAPGKKTYVPTSGHTDDSFYVEHWFSDISQSEQFSGCKISKVDIDLPATGMAKITFTLMGKDMTTGTSAYYTSPTSETVTSILVAVNGSLRVNGADITTLTALKFTIDGGHTMGEVIGSNTTPDIFEGRVKITGEFSAYFENGDLRDVFSNENEIAINFKLNADNTANSEFLCINIPRIKLNGADKDDGEKGTIQTIPFKALLFQSGGAGTAYDSTTISLQDSLIS